MNLDELVRSLRKWRDESPETRYGSLHAEPFEAGYKAAIADVKAGGPGVYSDVVSDGKTDPRDKLPEAPVNLNELALKVMESCGKHEKLQDAYLRFAHRLVAELAKQEPVGHVVEWVDGSLIHAWLGEPPPNGTPLYAAPVIPAGWVMVPDDLLRQLKHYTICHLMNFPSCGAPTEAEIDSMLAAAPKGE